MLLSLTEIKQYLKITSTTYDSLLTAINTNVQSMIEGFINRKLDIQVHYKLYSLRDNYELLLDDIQIKSIEKIATDLDIKNKTYSTEITEYIFNKEVGLINFYNSIDTGEYNIYIEYTSENNNQGIKHILLDMISKKYYDVDQKRFGLNSKNIMNENINFSYSDITEDDTNFLKEYRKIPGLLGMEVDKFTSI